ncbi:MAG TPA: hypothetical protein VIK16_01055, partial [Candidatus Limnocylindrales bacterium]
MHKPRVDRVEALLVRPEMNRAEPRRGKRRGQRAGDPGCARGEDAARRVGVRCHGRDARRAAKRGGQEVDAGRAAIGCLGPHLDDILDSRPLAREVADGPFRDQAAPVEDPDT